MEGHGMTEATIPLAAARAMLDAMAVYIPDRFKFQARAEALAIGIGYAYPKVKPTEPPKR